jgi:hypothetical protein
VPISTSGAVPSELRISVFDAYQALTFDRRIQNPMLPSAFIDELPATDQEIRIAVSADPAVIGGTRFVAHAHARVQSPSIELGPVGSDAAHADADGDGVPDLIDNCPQVANADQSNQNGDGVGDACEASAPLDGGADLAGSPSLCATSAIPFCDGFESGMLDVANWPAALLGTQGGSVVIDHAMTYRGMGSVRVNVAAVTNNTMPQVVATIGENRQITTPIYIRGFFRVPSAAATNFDLLRASNTDGYNFNIAVGNGDFQLSSNVVPGFYHVTKAGAWSFDRWFCVELAIIPNGANTDTKMWVDDVDMAVDSTVNGIPRIDAVGFGLQYAPAPMIPSFNIWMDELAVDTMRITCSR